MPVVISPKDIKDFQALVWNYYQKSGRDLPWRCPEGDGTFDPYKIIVSELMLQQTQVTRVIPKYESFITRFPSWQDLANASLQQVIGEWMGLGYNRRAKYLWQTAQQVTSVFGSKMPKELNMLTKLPGIGANTAGAIRAYAFNLPAMFIETNIRSVYIHCFFTDRTKIADSEILLLLQRSLPLRSQNYRESYWALMDYGSHLKATAGNAAAKSAHYRAQSAFRGSKRQLRAAVLRSLLKHSYTIVELAELHPDERLEAVLNELASEQFISVHDQLYQLQ